MSRPRTSLLSALDGDTRGEMYALLASVRAATGVTSLHITHNVGEAENLADKLLVFKNGRITEGAAVEDSDSSGF